MSLPINVLGSSVRHLRDTVDELAPGQLDSPAYPDEWTTAQVLSHLGSGAVIFQRRLEDGLAGEESPADFAPQVWEEWIAKSSQAVAADALRADRAFLERLLSTDETERAEFSFTMGPLIVDFSGLVGLRLNEHALHTWDIEVAMNRNAALKPDAVGILIDRLGMIVRFTANPTDAERQVRVRTTDPGRDFLVVLGPTGASLTTAEGSRRPDIELSAEAFIRLVYGRLDPEHAPAGLASAELDNLQRTFPGP